MTKGKRVLHFIDTIGPGGAETVFLDVASGLRSRGWDSRTALIGPGWVLENVQARDLPVDLVPTRGRLDLAYLRGLRAVVLRHEIDLIHAHLFSASVYASVVGASCGVPVVATFHGQSDTERGTVLRWLRLKLLERASNLVCVSEALKQRLVEDAGLGAERVQVIHNGVDLEVFPGGQGRRVRQEHGVPDDVFLVGALGNVRSAKDYPMLLEAASLLEGGNRIAFAIVGEPTEPLYGELLVLRKRLGLEERVSFWGFRRDVPDVMSAFDMLTISSSTEGFSLAAVQAMASGTPVAATRSGGPEQIITHEADGLLVPVGAPEAMASAIRRMAGDGRMRDRLSRAARETVERRFSRATMLDRYEDVYRALT